MAQSYQGEIDSVVSCGATLDLRPSRGRIYLSLCTVPPQPEISHTKIDASVVTGVGAFERFAEGSGSR